MFQILRQLSLRTLYTLLSASFIFATADDKAVTTKQFVTPIVSSLEEFQETIGIQKSSEDDLYLSEEEINLIALVTMAEAEGECEEGKRLVIDTILNRVDSGYFPDSVYSVVYQANQFSSVWNGRMNRCYVRDDICELIIDEAKNRTNSDVVFFTSGKYSKYGVPMLQVENHYFSSYD